MTEAFPRILRNHVWHAFFGPWKIGQNPRRGRKTDSGLGESERGEGVYRVR